MKNDNYHLGQLFWPVSQIDIQRIMLGFLVEGHILLCFIVGVVLGVILTLIPMIIIVIFIKKDVTSK